MKAMIEDFFDGFAKGDISAMRACLNDDVKSYITQAAGDVALLDGADALLANLANMNTQVVKPSIQITQLAEFNQNQALVMIEIKATRRGKSLHNFAAFLLGFVQDKISEIRMVEALPAYSDEFWNT